MIQLTHGIFLSLILLYATPSLHASESPTPKRKREEPTSVVSSSLSSKSDHGGKHSKLRDAPPTRYALQPASESEHKKICAWLAQHGWQPCALPASNEAHKNTAIFYEKEIRTALLPLLHGDLIPLVIAYDKSPTYLERAQSLQIPYGDASMAAIFPGGNITPIGVTDRSVELLWNAIQEDASGRHFKKCVIFTDGGARLYRIPVEQADDRPCISNQHVALYNRSDKTTRIISLAAGGEACRPLELEHVDSARNATAGKIVAIHPEGSYGIVRATSPSGWHWYSINLQNHKLRWLKISSEPEPKIQMAGAASVPFAVIDNHIVAIETGKRRGRSLHALSEHGMDVSILCFSHTNDSFKALCDGKLLQVTTATGTVAESIDPFTRAFAPAPLGNVWTIFTTPIGSEKGYALVNDLRGAEGSAPLVLIHTDTAHPIPLCGETVDNLTGGASINQEGTSIVACFGRKILHFVLK